MHKSTTRVFAKFLSAVTCYSL